MAQKPFASLDGDGAPASPSARPQCLLVILMMSSRIRDYVPRKDTVQLAGRQQLVWLTGASVSHQQV